MEEDSFHSYPGPPICILFKLLYLKLHVYINKYQYRYHYCKYLNTDWKIKLIVFVIVDRRYYFMFPLV